MEQMSLPGIKSLPRVTTTVSRPQPTASVSWDASTHTNFAQTTVDVNFNLPAYSDQYGNPVQVHPLPDTGAFYHRTYMYPQRKHQWLLQSKLTTYLCTRLCQLLQGRQQLLLLHLKHLRRIPLSNSWWRSVWLFSSRAWNRSYNKVTFKERRVADIMLLTPLVGLLT